MTDGRKFGKSYRAVSASGLGQYETLASLALDMRSSWNHEADEIWRRLDRGMWDLTHNPWAVLQTVSDRKLDSILGDPEFQSIIKRLSEVRQQAISTPTWFRKTQPKDGLKDVAYFSMEFMLSELLPIYSGGLGNVAGDQLKAASDLGVPVMGVGLLYQQGYFRQMIDESGGQEALYPYNDPDQIPVAPLRGRDGEWVRIPLDLMGDTIWLRAWQVQVGRVKLYLLDSNDVANAPAVRPITSQLYGGGHYIRFMQEVILGIGGWKLLEAVGPPPEVVHLNEGHAAFAVLARAERCMRDTGMAFDAALTTTRRGNIFTTHTAVGAGFDRFPPDLLGRYLTIYAESQLGIPLNRLLALGRQNPDDPAELFNMAYLAVRGSGAVNGVSRLHGCVSRHLFQPLFPRWPTDEVPIGHVTNGVYMPGWDSAAADELWTKACGKDRWLGSIETLENGIRNLSDLELWQSRNAARRDFIGFIRGRYAKELRVSGATSAKVEAAGAIFDPEILTIGFARRFAEYKRPNLLLYNQQRLLRILSDRHRPVQLVIAGKAHPADLQGQELIRDWIQFIQRREVQPHVIFLSDYDVLVTERLVQGVDVWINTPRRPWEACGTSGMKVLVNGGINISELDGWWAEAYSPDVGWAFGGGGSSSRSQSDVDNADAEALYSLLEQEVIPAFYSRNGAGIPTAWIGRMRESMARLTPRYSTNRSVRDYVEKCYQPAANQYRARVADNGKVGRQYSEWLERLNKLWQTIRFGDVEVTTSGSEHRFRVEVYLNGLDPGDVCVQLYADSVAGSKPVRQIMDRINPSANPTIYVRAVPISRPPEHFTPRIVPAGTLPSMPLEAPQILWQK